MGAADGGLQAGGALTGATGGASAIDPTPPPHTLFSAAICRLGMHEERPPDASPVPPPLATPTSSRK